MKSMNQLSSSFEVLNFHQLRNIIGGDGDNPILDGQEIDMPDIVNCH